MWTKLRQHLTLDLPQPPMNPVWIHACSVGEVASTASLINALLVRNYSVHMTVVTATGMAQAKRLFGNKITISYLPWDIPGLMTRLINKLKPRLLLLTETEFWPGMLATCHHRGIPIIGINTRISDRSFPRYHASRWLWRRCLSHVEVFFAQSRLDAERLQAIGVKPNRIQIVGNMKYTVTTPSVDAASIRKRLDPSQRRPILLAASTHPDEESSLLHMLPQWRKTCPDLLLVLVPRHPERFDAVGRMISQSGFRCSLWSEHDANPGADVVMIDAMGVLRELYAVADLVFIGGSLVPVGGHNPLEATVCGRSVITGPHIHNFREIMETLQRKSAALVARNAEELEQIIQSSLINPDELQAMHARAAAFMKNKADILPKIMSAIEPHLARTIHESP